MNIRALKIQVCLGSNIRMHEYAHTYIHIGTYTVHTYIHISLLVHLQGKILISSHKQSPNPKYCATRHNAIYYHVVRVEQYTTWLVLNNVPVV